MDVNIIHSITPSIQLIQYNSIIFQLYLLGAMMDVNIIHSISPSIQLIQYNSFIFQLYLLGAMMDINIEKNSGTKIFLNLRIF